MRIGIDTTCMVQVSIREHPGHAAARNELAQRLAAKDVLVMAPQVVAEFVHVVTDPRRFEQPLSVAEALHQAHTWWNAEETERVMPTADSMFQFWRWMAGLGLGRKRLLDTLLAATYVSHGVNAIISSNARDYRIFGCFNVIVPE